MNIRKKMLPMALASLLLLAGCGGTNGSEDKSSDIVTDLKGNVEITFWHGMTGAQEKSLKKLTDEFTKDHSNIKVTLQNQSSYQDLQQKITSTLQSPKNLPTITQAYPDWLADPITDDQVVPLDDYINNSNKDLAFDNYDDVLQGLRDGVKIDGKTYGLPFNKSTEVIWYNTDMFKELGLTPPTTMDELKTVSQKIHDAKGIPGVGFDSLANFYITWLENNGTDFNAKLDVTGKQSKAAFKYYQDGVKGGYFRTAGTDKYMSGPFSSQKVGMYIGSNAGESFVKEGAAGKFQYAAAPYPAEKARQQGTDIYMFSSATAEQRTAAYLYMKFLTEKDSQITWALDTGYMPVRKSAIDDPKYSDSGSAVSKILADATKNLYSTQVVHGSDAASNDVQDSLEAVLANPNSSIDDALTKLKPTFESDWQE